ncbi:MAG TPA: hypothetical protein VHP58_01475 [Alphaproteobacteria bacterium]|nr:hypothetical protein [Alphaproteobacteria bacterium]
METLDKLNWALRRLKRDTLKRMRALRNKVTLKIVMNSLGVAIRLTQLILILSKIFSK